jgi:2-keto-4-pentenoate hydratase/2-oxohepta-3-ene-1,7-dioic acid hydratase in catechol pathway
MRSRDSLVGHGEPIRRPPESEQLDYEGELVLVIGKAGRRIAEDRALEHVAGLACGNEGSVRDWMRHGTVNITQGKNFDRSGAVGPWLVTLDEVADIDDLRLTTRVNGEVRQDDNTGRMTFPVRFLVRYISTFTTLQPGDLIFTGTPAGAGASFKPPKWLVPGDEVTVEIAGVGRLANRVVDEG